MSDADASIVVRLLGTGEGAVLDDVADGVFDNPVHPRWRAEFFADPRHHIVVALDGGRVVGMTTAVHYVHPDKPPELWINEVGVAPAYQRRGIARRMMEAMLAHGSALGCGGAWLGTELDNVAARRLYHGTRGSDGGVAMAIYTFAIGDDAPTGAAAPPAHGS